MFPIKICLKNRSAPVTVSMVAKWPPLSGKNKDIISNLLVLCSTHMHYFCLKNNKYQYENNKIATKVHEFIIQPSYTHAPLYDS